MTDTQNLTGLNRDALRKIAAELKIPGRGNMLKPELIAAIAAAQPFHPAGGPSGTVHVIPDADSVEVETPVRIPGTPLTTTQREDNYRRQNGSSRLTARQARRTRRKANRAAR